MEKIIHQTWKTADIPEKYSAFVESWKRDYPDYEYRLWTDEDNRQLIKNKYPWFLKTYDNYPHNIQRVDAARYFILYTFGGIYVDLDFKSFKSIEDKIGDVDICFALESDEHCKMHKKEKIISNAWMASVSGHYFFKMIIDSLERYKKRGVLDSTGPFFLNRIYHKYHDKTQIKLLPAKYYFPLSYLECEKYIEGKNYNEKLKDAYGIHLHFGTWWKN
jgi:mannosyltransferase OCH1-like enzyme